MQPRERRALDVRNRCGSRSSHAPVAESVIRLRRGRVLSSRVESRSATTIELADGDEIGDRIIISMRCAIVWPPPSASIAIVFGFMRMAKQ